MTISLIAPKPKRIIKTPKKNVFRCSFRCKAISSIPNDTPNINNTIFMVDCNEYVISILNKTQCSALSYKTFYRKPATLW